MSEACTTDSRAELQGITTALQDEQGDHERTAFDEALMALLIKEEQRQQTLEHSGALDGHAPVAEIRREAAQLERRLSRFSSHAADLASLAAGNNALLAVHGTGNESPLHVGGGNSRLSAVHTGVATGGVDTGSMPGSPVSGVSTDGSWHQHLAANLGLASRGRTSSQLLRQVLDSEPGTPQHGSSFIAAGPCRPGRFQVSGSERASFIFNDDADRYAMLKALMQVGEPEAGAHGSDDGLELQVGR